MTNEPAGEARPTQADVTRRTDRSSTGSVIVAIASGIAAMGLTVLTVVLMNTWQHPTVPEASPDTSGEFFEAIRLSDADLSTLGMEASGSGFQPSTLGTAATKVQYEWRNAKGEPAECLFAGWSPGTSVYPVTGAESDVDPLWKEKVVSGTQTLTLDDVPFVNVTSRVFAGEAAAIAYLAAVDELVPACTAFTTEQGQVLTTTTVAPLHYVELDLPNAGWVASTPEWNVSYTGLEARIVPVELYVLDMQQGNAVVRLTMFSPPDPDNRDGFLQIADIVSDNLARAIG